MNVDIGDVINQTSFTHYQPNLQVRFGAPKGHVAVMILLGHADKKAPELFDAKSALRKLGWVEHTELDSARSDLDALRDELGAVKGEYDRAVNNVAALREQLTQHAIAIRDMNVTEAALREELASVTADRDQLKGIASAYIASDGAKDLRIAAAEQRNAVLRGLLEEALGSVYVEARRAETAFASRLHTGLADRIEAALKPAESGASE